ncbi:hypothetical protein PIB30_088199 [Stylosanthes scabra]|uniref:Uncharacterized protein n=1 Tax=Stylosanthes scabra TaxID=79078 RepID=A0ABU6TTC5_9FABA|nr:hypothetical protein [Stylosanthes scabra]
MACKGSSPLAKGKGKIHELPMRASPRLAALRSRVAAKNQLGTPVTLAINTPTPSLPIKKRPLQKATSEDTSKARARSFRRRYRRIAAIGRTFIQEPAPKDNTCETAKRDGDEEEDPDEDP